MAKRKSKKKNGAMAEEDEKADGNVLIDETFRIQADEIIRDFINDPIQVQYEFPANLTKEMRGYIHNKCNSVGLKTQSKGKKSNRSISMMKRAKTTKAESIKLSLAPATVELLQEASRMPLVRNTEYHVEPILWDCISKLSKWPAVCPILPKHSEYSEFRKSLPIYNSRDDILETIRNNQVTVVTAETGSGKTTQIPQYIIEEAAEHNQVVRVLCTQPRRLSTIAVATRVSEERNELLGKTIGYQIKLESKIGQGTAVIYCTNGILLRTLMGGEACFTNVTHIIVDEIHERDKFTDFLLITLRSAVQRFPHLHLILMSATMDVKPFEEYFNPIVPAVLAIEGRSFTCCALFLTDILKQISYENEHMRTLRQLRERHGGSTSRNGIAMIKPKHEEYAELDSAMQLDLNEVLAHCFDTGSDEAFTDAMIMYLNENINPNYQDWSGKTALMAACKHGNVRVAEQLLGMGADMFLSSAEGITASGWAQQANHMDVVSLLTLYEVAKPGEIMAPSHSLLGDYLLSVNSNLVDNDLVVELIKYIHFNIDKENAILVFLPGYEDILSCNTQVLASELPEQQYKLIMLHGSMQTKSQRDVFKRYPGKQKIILSTNIAETSITIDDVRFVIDTGRAKIKTYDPMTGISSLKSDWISMANTRQRAGRAGRTQNGYSFHLYSKERCQSFASNPTPEILRTPLHELCLQTKILAPVTMSISDFIGLAIDPPQKISVEQAIKTLKCLGALDEDEQMTTLGRHLVQFSIEPRLGKMLLYSVVMKCLDPILTLVATVAQKDPFVLPAHLTLKQTASQKRKELAVDCLSDHLILIRAFQQWQENKAQNRGFQFCNAYFISPAVMELTTQTRAQLLSQLRAMGFVQSSPRESICEVNEYSHVWPVVKSCFAAGLYPNVALHNNGNLHNNAEKITISAASCLKGSAFDAKGTGLLKDAWMIYDEIVKPQRKATVKSATVITPITVALICGQNTLLTDQTILMDETFIFETDHDAVMHLRNNISNIFFKKIIAPHTKQTVDERETLRLFAKILMSEEERYELQSPRDIGKRPLMTHLALKHSRVEDAMRDSNPRRHSHSNNLQHNWRSSERATYRSNDCGIPSISTSSKFFLIQAMQNKRVSSAINQCLWRFAPHSANVIYTHFQESREICLLFHVQDSNEIQGVAKLLDISNEGPNQVCRIEWISTNRIPIFCVRSELPGTIQFSHECFELTSSVGYRIAKRIYETNSSRSMAQERSNDYGSSMQQQHSRAGHSRAFYQ